jgi:hypothetical protein
MGGSQRMGSGKNNFWLNWTRRRKCHAGYMLILELFAFISLAYLFCVKLRIQSSRVDKIRGCTLFGLFFSHSVTRRSKHLIEFMQSCLKHLLVRKHSLVFGGRKVHLRVSDSGIEINSNDITDYSTASTAPTTADPRRAMDWD